MLDTRATQAIQPLITWVARRLARLNVSATQISIFGFILGIFAFYFIAVHVYFTALLLILASRLCDGLDGAVARLTAPTDAGGFLDISLDFLFYASIPLAFAIADPLQNALPAAVLLAAFVGTGSSFLAFATLAAKRGMHSLAYPHKSLYFLGGLTEATETLLCFVAMCLWPHKFPELAYIFALMCGFTIVTRIGFGWHALQKDAGNDRQQEQPKP